MRLFSSRHAGLGIAASFLALTALPSAAWATDLTIELDAPATASPGSVVTVAAVVTANQVAGENVTLLLLPPEGATFGSPPKGCAADAGALMCDLGALVPADTSVEVEVEVEIDADLEIGSSVLIDALSSATNEINPANNGESVSISIAEGSAGCVDDGDCQEGEICVEGECVVEEVSDCSSDADCASGFCDGGLCAPADEGEEVVDSGGCSVASGAAHAPLLAPFAALLAFALRRRRTPMRAR